MQDFIEMHPSITTEHAKQIVREHGLSAQATEDHIYSSASSFSVTDTDEGVDTQKLFDWMGY